MAQIFTFWCFLSVLLVFSLTAYSFSFDPLPFFNLECPGHADDYFPFRFADCGQQPPAQAPDAACCILKKTHKKTLLDTSRFEVKSQNFLSALVLVIFEPAVVSENPWRTRTIYDLKSDAVLPPDGGESRCTLPSCRQWSAWVGQWHSWFV